MGSRDPEKPTAEVFAEVAEQTRLADELGYAIAWDEFPNVKRWLEEISERPAVKKAMAMGPEFREDPTSISAEEQARRRKLVADQRAQPIPSEWIRAA
jgi:hypothetical protein